MKVSIILVRIKFIFFYQFIKMYFVNLKKFSWNSIINEAVVLNPFLSLLILSMFNFDCDPFRASTLTGSLNLLHSIRAVYELRNIFRIEKIRPWYQIDTIYFKQINMYLYLIINCKEMSCKIYS